jgi:uncharacterized protein (TIGR02147 family)
MQTEREIQNVGQIVLMEAPELLQEELGRRIAKNPKYSLRAFARTLGLSPATLSLILSNKTPLTESSLGKISSVLALSPSQTQHLRHQIVTRKLKIEEPIQDSDFKYVTLDIFKALSEWYYYAILSLFDLKDSSTDPKWISKKLGISVFEAREAIERLQRLGLISKVKGQWKQVSKPLRIDDVSSTSASRRFQRQLLSMALESLEIDPVEIRDVTSMTLSMNKKDMSYAIDKIAEFRRKLTRDLEQRSEPNSVYNLTIQLFPVTKE